METPIIDNFAYDSTDFTNDGQFEGGMDQFAQIPGKIAGSLEFDGSDDMIRVPDDVTLDATQDEGTFELWINWVDAADGDQQIVMTSSNRFTPGMQDGYEWASQFNGNHFFYPWGGDGSNYNLGPNPFMNDIWHHLAVTLKRALGRSSSMWMVFPWRLQQKTFPPCGFSLLLRMIGFGVAILIGPRDISWDSLTKFESPIG